MIIKACAIAIALFINLAPALYLKNIWENEGTSDQDFEKLYEVYVTKNGYDQWMKDAEYIMSQEFVSQYLDEINKGITTCNSLFDYWKHCTASSRGFDLYWSKSKWTESNRDDAFYLVNKMITTYLALLCTQTNNTIKNVIADRINDLRCIKKNFFIIVSQDNDIFGFEKAYLINK